MVGRLSKSFDVSEKIKQWWKTEGVDIFADWLNALMEGTDMCYPDFLACEYKLRFSDAYYDYRKLKKVNILSVSNEEKSILEHIADKIYTALTDGNMVRITCDGKEMVAKIFIREETLKHENGETTIDTIIKQESETSIEFEFMNYEWYFSFNHLINLDLFYIDLYDPDQDFLYDDDSKEMEKTIRN